MKKAIGHVKMIANNTLKYRKPRELRQYNFADSSFAPNADDRKSVSAEVVTLGGVPISISSRTQKCVTLSSSESELVALTSCAQETKFVQMLLEEIDSTAIRPAIIYEDNVGAIFLSENQQVGSRTKHIETRHFYIREMLEDQPRDDARKSFHFDDQENKEDKDETHQDLETRWIELRYVPSEGNYADIGTKNVATRIFTAMGNKITNGMLLE